MLPRICFVCCLFGWLVAFVAHNPQWALAESGPVTQHLGDSVLRSLSDNELERLSNYSNAPVDSVGHPDGMFREPDEVQSRDIFPLDRPRGQESPKAHKSGRYCMNGHERAGYPLCVGNFAKPSISSDYSVGYVGGGSLFSGFQRFPSEGTFGLDYAGHWFSRKTWLHWSHGRRYQGGAGAYATEGPKLHE
ncbi:MAG: hypothetical protein NTW52_15545 [Planctomycetota bacterium]|nr:hypothetical protein [Planctomycetota bacterium]